MDSFKEKNFGLFIRNSFHFQSLFFLGKWLIISGVIGVLAGSASALFLASLDWATNLRNNTPILLFFLPLAGVIVSYVYMKYGATAGKGNNLILEQIHNSKDGVPLRMAPLVLFGTVMTHLFGGSAGREGTAVQMGSSLADAVWKRLKLSMTDRKIILICGISAGFGSVFGTPLAGTIFALEVLVFGIIRYRALIPSFFAALIGDRVTTAWGIPHTHYSLGVIPEFSVVLLLKIIVAAIIFGLTALLFSKMSQGFKTLFSAYFKNPMIKSFVGGSIVVIVVLILGTRDYIGLSLPLIHESFEGEVSPLSFFWKTLLTTITLGAGFQGGEVTPLFTIGATLGNTLSSYLGIPTAFLAGLGFIAVFAGATNTPFACFVMGIELFGADAAIYLFTACAISYMFSGHTGIYTSQIVGVAKSNSLEHHEESPLSNLPKSPKPKEDELVWTRKYTS
ncbi:voltage-gated chloride channel family protein [Salipaludibacillus agaradhaerens]|jgi:H+/Cl- antiporter ClcA|uniref:voltage-gated chloride channel family protein n=1 Tax=Salipaludibacillus agaradhaerens TaxID=76935 RepID=UPI0021506FF5|nr:voltage-gated chloride channel family protein [Salipaludibacillus agaradhaerens]MCR6106648.1 voltage-gated chloride channel family protein [Salipaludibacillus agaradhaerens]MCR6118681.1 voltage-gated chloride channel family protein [Salipaludibacillus agaradhaerens]UJW57762.1 voltage-gated chloride channel family protein [Bacillus sp. A116_S68]